MVITLWLLGCVTSLEDTATTATSATTGTTGPATEDTDTAEGVEVVPGVEEDPVDENGDTVFRNDQVHDIALSIPEDSMDELRLDPRSYVPAFWTHEGETLEVGVRLKGNTSYTWFNEKPSLIVDFDFAVADQRYRGIPSLYLQNMTWDPSMVHEHLTYWFMRSLGVPASRTAYTRLTIDGEPYGLYLVLEKQNSLFRKQWWEDRTGSIYEAGSFNHPCDLSYGGDDDPCTCFEIDRVGEDSFEDLQDLCLASRSLESDWQEQVSQHVDWDVFLQAQAADCARPGGNSD